MKTSAVIFALRRFFGRLFGGVNQFNKQGQKHGQWIMRLADGTVGEGRYLEGRMNGYWVVWGADGTVAEGHFIGDKQHGLWVLRSDDGSVSEGPFVDGKLHGHWVMRHTNGSVHEGFMVDGERTGHWVKRFANGCVEEGPYIEGKEHGHWILRSADGSVMECPFVNGKPHGEWVLRDVDGGVQEVSSPTPEAAHARRLSAARGTVAFQALLESLRGRLGLTHYTGDKTTGRINVRGGYVRTGTRAVNDKAAEAAGLSPAEFRQLQAARGTGDYLWLKHMDGKARESMGGSRSEFADEFPAWLMGDADAEFERALGAWLTGSAPAGVGKALMESRAAIRDVLSVEGMDMAAAERLGQMGGLDWHERRVREGERWWNFMRAAARRRLFGGVPRDMGQWDQTLWECHMASSEEHDQ